ncbi:SNF2 family N-terminal domain-containing protein [Dichotomocladium elegans]|nr:SNF2 family N-terminal domain-containing protein [Dichotomocladium elegans]
MLPGSISKEKLGELLQRAKSLQSQGATEGSDAEYARIMSVLKNLQNHQKMQLSQNEIETTAMQLRSIVRSDAASLTHQQLTALRYQILAYRLLSKNLPLSPHLQRAVFHPTAALHSDKENTSMNHVHHDSTDEITSRNTEGVSTTADADNLPDTPGSISLENHKPDMSDHQQPPRSLDYNAFASPYNLVKKPISSYSHAARHQRIITPSITPSGMDPHSIIADRERRIRARIQYRIGELERLPSNLMLDGQNLLSADKNGERATSTNTKLKAVVELKALRKIYNQLRQEIITGLDRSTTLATSVDRLSYRRMKKQSLREARMTEKIERQQRIDRDRRERQKHLDYLQTICDHGRDLVATQKAWQAKQFKLGRAVLQYHQHVEKEEQKKQERISRERIRALKNDDEEAYMKLIDEAKDTRLTQLLRQTGAFLESLSKAVLDQQNDIVHREAYNDIVPTTIIEEGETDSKGDYFQVTHRIKEDVSQPSILVGGKLKEYQIKGLQWMVSLYNNNLNGILADEMGLGKTIQTISLITYLIEKKKQNGPFLIIVPLSTMTNWALEFDKWAPSVKTIVYKGPPNSRKMLQADIRYGEFQVLLTTFEYIIKDRPILSKIRWVHMIIDEGHRMKNTNSKLTSVLRQYYHTRYRLILTGTPLQNNLPELWALLNFILPKIFKSVKTFEEWFNTPFNNQGVQDRIALNEEEQLLIIKRLHKVLRPFLLRRLKKDVESELPDKVERVIKCKLSALQSKLYSQMKKSGILFTATGEKGKTGIKGLNNTIMQLRKICNHPFVFEEVERAVNPNQQSDDLLYRVSGKFELLDRMLPKLKETGHRVLIFFQMTQIMTIMEDYLTYRGFQYLRLDGSTKADDRSALLHKFNAPDSPYFVFLLSTRAGGLGLNLQAADTVIIFDSDWNPHQDLQAQDRAHRIGQTKEVRIFRLISANSIEENILARAQYKLDIDGKVIQAGKFDNRSTDEDREAFLANKADEQEEAEEDEVDDEELNEMLQRSEDDLVIFNKMDAIRRREENDLKRRARNRGTKWDRLIHEEELPDIYQHDDVPFEEEDPLEYGRGQRSKDFVRYDDGLTEEQWLNALEDDDVDLDELIKKKEARRRRRLEKMKLKEAGMSVEAIESTMRRSRGQPVLNNQESVAASPKKRRRPKNNETEVTSPQQGRIKRTKKDVSLLGPDTVSARVREKMTRIFEQCYMAVEDSVDVDEDGDERQRCELFMDLVSKREYPTYYIMIKNPISMNMIKKRIHSSYYKSVDEFKNDFTLMFDNARLFNEEGSFVYEDANAMQEIFNSKLKALCPGGRLPLSDDEDQ